MAQVSLFNIPNYLKKKYLKAYINNKTLAKNMPSMSLFITDFTIHKAGRSILPSCSSQHHKQAAHATCISIFREQNNLSILRVAAGEHAQ